MISVVIPAYNEEKMIMNAAETISNILINENITFEIVFIDDGSIDKTWNIIEKSIKTNKNIKGVKFSRNFGKEAAIFAGLSNSIGDCCVVIDCDLQHPPQEIIKMYRLYKEGYDIVEGIKNDRGSENLFKKVFTKFFYTLITKATNIDMKKSSDFKLLSKKTVNVLLNMQESNTFFRAMSSWIGFKTAIVEFDVAERAEGETKWSTISLMKYALNNITSYTTIPMQFITFFGVLTLFFSFIYIILDFNNLNQIEHINLLINLLIGSLLMISLGIIGYYLSKIYEEIKKKPKYIISKILEGDICEK